MSPNFHDKHNEHVGCTELHENLMRSTEVLENLLYLLENEADPQRVAKYCVAAKAEIEKLRRSSREYRGYVSQGYRSASQMQRRSAP